MFKWLRRQKWRKALQGVDYDTAKTLLATQFSESIIRTDFGNRLDRFLANPCYDTAADLLDLSPELITYFDSSRPGSAMDRLFKM